MKLLTVSRLDAVLKKRIPAVLLLGVLCLATAPVAQAQLTLHLDTTAETLWFTGSDSGTTEAEAYLAWGIYGNGSGSTVAHSFNVADLFTSTLTFDLEHAFQAKTENDSFFIVLAANTDDTSVTLTGKGSMFTYDYSGFAAADKTFLEGLTSLPSDIGTGFSSITVATSAVPEPSTYAALFGVIALFGTIALRKRAKQA